VELDPGDVALLCLGWSGFVIVIVAWLDTALLTFIGQDWQANPFLQPLSKRKPP